MSTVNTNPKTGIRYGAIDLRNLDDWVYDDIEMKTNCSTCMECEELNSETDICSGCDAELCYFGKIDGVKFETFYLGGVHILLVKESSHFAHVNLCDPCIPNAGNLDNKNRFGEKCYDVPPDWYR